MEIVIGVQFQDHQDPHSIDHRSIMQFASRLENNPRYLNKLSFLSDSEKLSKASHKSCRISIHQPKSSETRVSEQICLRCEIRQSICGQTAEKITEKYEVLQDLGEAFDNFSKSERKLNLSERARSADSGAIFGFKSKKD